MEEINYNNLSIVGKVQHGEQRISGKSKRAVELGYFIVKVKNEEMSFLENRFNEKYNKSNKIKIRIFDENPFLVKRAKYNTKGLVCYCLDGQSVGKEKNENKWQEINCNEECQDRYIEDGKSKPNCCLEGTLRFILPDISSDRVWTETVKGYTSVKRLDSYFKLQKKIGNSIIGDYILFLNKEKQTNKNGQSFNNQILDIIKEEDFISNTINNSNLSTQKSKTVDNNVKKDEVSTTKPKQSENILKENKKSEITQIEEKKNTKKKTKKETTIQNETKQKQENKETKNEFENYYTLVETSTKKLMKAGKPTEYLIGNFVDIKDKTIDVVIPPQFANELSQCDIGTTVILDLATIGDKTFTNSIKYAQKYLKNVAA